MTVVRRTGERAGRAVRGGGVDRAGHITGLPGRQRQGVAYLTRVEAGRQREGFDRVVWEFDGPAPSYRVEYAAARFSRLALVIDVVETGDFENTLSYALGMGINQPPYTVTTLSDPTRIVLDLAYCAGAGAVDRRPGVRRKLGVWMS